jgi:hypothetical protein
MLYDYEVNRCEITKVSIVGDPAIQLPFAFRGCLLWGPVLVPDKKIFRCWEDGTYFNCIFRRAMIANLADHFNNESINFEHSGVQCTLPIISNGILTDDITVGGVTYPHGTWMLGLHVLDVVVLNLITSKVMNGFSIEANVEYKRIKEV